MKNAKKLLAISIMAILILGAGFIVNARQGYLPPSQGEYIQNLPDPENLDLNLGNFLSFRGQITEITQGDFGHNLTVVSEEYGTAVFMLSSSTFILGQEPTLGDNVIGFYSSFGIARLIYPPHHDIAVLITDTVYNVKVDGFREVQALGGDLVSNSNDLIIRPNETTSIQDHLGNRVDWDLNGRNLVVVYDISTRSMPAIATPNLVVVLPVEGMMPEMPVIGGMEPLPYIAGYDDPSYLASPWDNYPIIVNGMGLSVNFIFYGEEENEDIFVPLRPVAVALGADIGWDPSTAQITVGDNISFTLGSNDFNRNDEIISLRSPSMLVEGTTYVSISFFRDIFGMNNAYFEGGHVTINNEEPMV